MEPADILPSLLELSIAIAGFSGVVAALQTRSEWTTQARALFSALLGSTFFTAGLVVLAMLLLASPLDSTRSWAATSAAHAASLGLVVVYRAIQIRRGSLAFSTTVQVVGLSFLVLISLQLANSFFFSEAWICLSALGFYAFYGFAYFVLLLQELAVSRAA